MTAKPAASAKSAKPAKGDDRNLVAVEDGGASTFEDKLELFWKRNRNAIYVAIGIGLAAIVAREGWRVYSANEEEKTRAAFGAAETIEEKAAFAREHAGHPLAGVALLAIADDAYLDADFAKAMTDYATAAKALTDPVLKARARLGEGVATLKAGLGTKAEPLLRGLAEDVAVPQAIRCEAWFQLAELAFSNENFPEVGTLLDRVTELDPAGPWASRAAGLRERLPTAAADAGASLLTP